MYIQVIFEHFLIYWTLSFLTIFFDVLNYDNWKLYKLEQPQIIDTLKNIVKKVVLNQLYSIPLFYLFTFQQGNISVSQIVLFIPTLILYEFLFYHLHYLLHIKPFYKYIHSVHHVWNKPISVSAFYAHPIEHLLINIFPLLLSARICGINFNGLRFIQLIGLVNTVIFAHGAYKIPYYENFHHTHHRKINCNYGLIGICDKLYDTQNY